MYLPNVDTYFHSYEPLRMLSNLMNFLGTNRREPKKHRALVETKNHLLKLQLLCE